VKNRIQSGRAHEEVVDDVVMLEAGAPATPCRRVSGCGTVGPWSGLAYRSSVIVDGRRPPCVSPRGDLAIGRRRCGCGGHPRAVDDLLEIVAHDGALRSGIGFRCIPGRRYLGLDLGEVRRRFALAFQGASRRNCMSEDRLGLDLVDVEADRKRPALATSTVSDAGWSDDLVERWSRRLDQARHGCGEFVGLAAAVGGCAGR